MADDSPQWFSRRRLLHGLSTGFVGLLAGCSNNGGTETTDSAEPTETDTMDILTTTKLQPTSTPTQTDEPTSTPASEPAIQIQNLSLAQTADPLPPVWTQGTDLEAFQTVLSAEITARNSLTIRRIALSRNETELRTLNPGQKSWNSQLRLTPDQLTTSTANLQIEAEASNGSIQSDFIEIPGKDVPETYKVDFIYGRNEEIKNSIIEDKKERIQDSNKEISEQEAREEAEEYAENYIQQHGDQVTEDPVITSYETPEEIEHNKKEIDLAALEYWHDNDFPQVADQPEEAREFVESIRPLEEAEGMAREAMIEGFYPNRDESSHEYGHFDYEEFSNSESAGEALDWIHRYLFNWQTRYPGSGPISTEDEQYAAVLQEALDEHTDIDSHFWAFDLPSNEGNATHGNGLVYDEDKNELRVMETIAGPATWESEISQYHCKIEDSNYLNLEHEASDEYWHPLRFAEEYQSEHKSVAEEFDNLSFKEAKGWTASLFRGITTGFGDEDIEETVFSSGITISNEYLADVTKKLRNWNRKDEYDQELFNKIKNQSKVYNKLYSMDENFVVCGNVENPQYAKVEDEGLIEDIWEDEEGRYDEFNQYLTGEVAA